MDPEERARRYGADSPLEFSHTVSDLIGGQLATGLHLTDMYEDFSSSEPINQYMPSFMATRAVKS
jgi:hypothetical protein